MNIKKQALQVKRNLTDFDIEEIISIVKRDRNRKRPFLILNKLQSKHYPSNPLKTDKLFSQLASKVKSEYPNKQKVLIIGFAETAVSIGIYVAEIFKDSYYIQTTREIIADKSFLTFDELHSHAVTHRLYNENLKEIIEQSDLIVIVDDEFTTGNTAVNLINTLKFEYKMQDNCSICISSILSCMKKEHLQRLKENNINLVTLIDTDLDSNSIIFPDNFLDDFSDYDYNKSKKSVSFHKIDGKTIPYFLMQTGNFINACDTFISGVFDIVGNFKNKNILVIGTEEFSFCALRLGIKLSETNNINVQCTTRSPILASNDINYTVHNRSSLVSFYDVHRTTYIYQMKHYDKVIVLTDSENPSKLSKKQLINSIDADKIFFIQWGVKNEIII